MTGEFSPFRTRHVEGVMQKASDDMSGKAESTGRLEGEAERFELEPEVGGRFRTEVSQWGMSSLGNLRIKNQPF